MQTLTQAQLQAALAAAEDDSAAPEERAEMLMEIAMGLQQRPDSAQQLHDAVRLYRRGLELAPPPAALLRARLGARLATALQALPDGGHASLEQALEALRAALPVLEARGRPEEAAEAELNQGLMLQALAGSGRARIQDAINAYLRALRTFGREAWPQEFAILHNNLAIAYLAIPATDERGKLREALAVRSFEAVLEVVNLVDHPSEYAMIQNNLGNALQSASSSHLLENLMRALAAYDEALKVRNPRDTPLAYANTIANKANVLRSLEADAARDVNHADLRDPLAEALLLLREAGGLFARHGEADKAALMAQAAAEVEAELSQRRCGAATRTN
jgi:tetratricopeptide (TPR) repeat protein